MHSLKQLIQLCKRNAKITVAHARTCKFNIFVSIVHRVEDKRTLKLAFSNAVVISVFEEFKYPRESVKAIDNMRAQRLVNMIFGTTLGILPTIGLSGFKSPTLFKHGQNSIVLQVIAQNVVVLHQYHLLNKKRIFTPGL